MGKIMAVHRTDIIETKLFKQGAANGKITGEMLGLACQPCQWLRKFAGHHLIARGYRIQVDAVAVDGRWNADVRLRRLFTEDKPQLERVTCYKLTPEDAERSAEIWARRWIDRQRGE